jgi:hypothetical protein
MAEAKFQIKAKAKTGHLMTDLGISEDRCKELCGLVESTIRANPDSQVIEVIEEVTAHSQSWEETVFLSETVGSYTKNPVEKLFEHIMSQRSMYEQSPN